MKKLILPIAGLLMVSTAVYYFNSPKATPSKSGVQEEAHFTDPGSRRYYEFERLKSPHTGKIPAGIRGKELAFAAKLPAKQEKSADNWAARGPNNKGGRTRAFALDITNDDILMAGGITGGMWRSTDNGGAWTKTTDPQFLHSVSCVVQDKREGHENVWYYGSGEEFYGVISGTSFTSLMSGDGMFKSTDSGQTWVQVESTSSNTPQDLQENGSYDFIWQIIPDPSFTEQDVVLAAVYNGVIRSEDGGDTWEQVLGFGAVPALHADIHRTTDGTFYAYLADAGTIDGVYRSTDGINWVDISIPQMVNFQRGVFTSDPNDPNEVYLIYEGATGQNDISHVLYKYTYLSGDGTNAGGQWEDRSANLPEVPCVLYIGANFDFGTFGSQGGYDLAISHHPTQDEVIYIGGRNIFRSMDGFQTEDNTEWIGGYRCNLEEPRDYSYPDHHSDQHMMVFKPSNPDVMYSANDGGVYLTEDALADSVNWTPLNNGYITTQFYTVAIEQGPAESDIVMGGMQDNGTWRTVSDDLALGWNEVHSDDGSFCAIPYGADFFLSSSQNGRIYKKKLAPDGTILGQKRIDPDDNIAYSFINPFIIDHVTNDEIYMAGNLSVYVLDSLSDIVLDDQILEPYPEVHWLKNTSSTVPATASRISALEMTIDDPNTLFYGTRKGRVFKLTNLHSPMDQQERVELNDDEFPNNVWTSAISINPTDSDEIMVSFANYEEQSIFHSLDGGETFVSVGGNLEENPDGSGVGPAVFWVEMYPTSPVTYFAGTSVGLFSTSLIDGDNTVWEQESPDIIGNVVINMIESRPYDGKLVIGTHGNGVYSADLPPVPEIYSVDESKVSRTEVTAFPNPFSKEVTLSWDGLGVDAEVSIFDNSGKIIVNEKAIKNGQYIWRPGALMAAGVYHYRLTVAGAASHGKLILQ